ncbi:flagellar hook-associated protein FlgK [Bacteriovorax sp. BSW11_IV]|uniref:flagellar hook-associated protein FlgK n=1 Tax=Bacteriovorax sp. BSW11_IV TaxID=1353529 RepID=UPI00038A0777|nr:flagellar hook-associated protein FlgK [Bacteriovorax sp. BSW11_IV]EQC45135.1 flagellar hook-associated protein FlgK [Bacteriovorax sp. BSW11_IV]
MSDLLNIGRTGLNVSKKSLETTGHNIANANTEGYSRQRVNQTTNISIVKGGLNHGTGARIKDVTRVHDPFVEKRFRDQTSSHEYYEKRSEYLTQVEEVFNEIDNGGLNQVMNRFFNSFRDLANQPENETIRSVVRDNAQLVIKDFKRIRESLDMISRNIDNSMSRSVEDVNQTLKNIAGLNKKIAELEAGGSETGDLRDQRDIEIKELSKVMKVHTYEDEKGSFVVSAVGVGTLVTAAQTIPLRYGTENKEAGTTQLDGSGQVYYQGRPAATLTERFQKGTMEAIAEVRDQDVAGLRKKIDEIAYNFINAVNAIHRKGFAHRDVKMDENGNPMQSADAKGPLTGIDFFQAPAAMSDAALNIELSTAVSSDLTNIATALAPNSPGDNRVAVAISKLQHEKYLDDGTATIEEYFLQTIGNVGLESGKTKIDLEQSTGLLAQIKNIKERISGVSIDEEAANMVRFQHAYEAAAKVMKTADEMFRTVIDLKR